MTSSPRPLLVDCDGVLLDWLSGFLRFAGDALGRSLDGAQPDMWNLGPFLGVEDAQVHEMISAFNRGAGGFFGALDPLPSAQDALAAAAAQGREITVITSCLAEPAVIAQRRQNLERAFGAIFADIHCLNPWEDKTPLLERYMATHGPSTWVEDKPENALKGARAGHRTFLLRTSYNVLHEGGADGLHHARMTWVDGWPCIMDAEGLVPAPA